MSSLTLEISENLLRLRREKQFRPFAIVLLDGRSIRVREQLSFTVIGDKVMLPGRDPSVVNLNEISKVQESVDMNVAELKLREQLIQSLVRKPFEPFILRMRSGTQHEIVRPFQAAIGETRGSLVNKDESSRTEFHIRDIQSLERLAIA